MALKIVALCVAVAMVCAALRTQRPELATVVSLAAGVASLAMLLTEADPLSQWIGRFRELTRADADITSAVLKGAGIAIVSELGAQLCADAGESALAGRIALTARIAMLGLCAPMLAELAGTIGGMIS